MMTSSTFMKFVIELNTLIVCRRLWFVNVIYLYIIRTTSLRKYAESRYHT